jgi:tetratricopeptide (TPR) repeat protein
MLGMAPVQYPGGPGGIEQESTYVQAEKPYADLDDAFLPDTIELPEPFESRGSPVREESFDDIDLGDDLGDDLGGDVSDDVIDDLGNDLARDIIVNDIGNGEISQFIEKTAITDVSTLAASSAEIEEMDDDLPEDLLDEIDALPGVDLDEALVDDLPPLKEFKPEPAPVRIGEPRRARISPTLAGGIGVGVAVIIGLVLYAVLSESDDTSADESATTVAEEGSEGTPGVPKKATRDKSVQELLGGATSELKAQQKKGPPHTCKPLTDYPKFPWKDKLEKVVKSVDTGSLCGLFGFSPDAIAAGLKKDPHYGPTGYDLMPKGRVFELFPMGKAVRRAPTIEFLFTDNQLFEIHLNYRMEAAKDLKMGMFTSLLGKPSSDKKDSLDRRVTRYEDGDMEIIHYQKVDAYKREFNDIVFRSKPITNPLKEALALREEAIGSFERGMGYFSQKQTKRAIDQFHKAEKAIPSMGIAYVFEGITWLQVEEFEKAAQAADKVIDKSSDDRAKAGAHGLHAVIALYSGDTMSAELLFRKAAELDPTDPEFSTSAKELSSGSYAPDRVAKTAARMSCLKENRSWSEKGLLARGNFPDSKTYMRAKNKAKRSSEYKSSYELWVGWECQ